MQTKLTLRLEAALIRRAKARARKQGKSLSVMVADYFATLDGVRDDESPRDVPPRTRALRGALRGTRVQPDDWADHLVRKYGS